MKKLAILSLVVTDDCNFHCSYCRQKRRGLYLTQREIEDFLSFAYPRLAEGVVDIVFYGGEPVLGMSVIRHTVSVLQSLGKGRSFRYTITTNGSLLDDAVVEFFGRHRFIVYLSFDGPHQDRFRENGSFGSIEAAALRLSRQPGIDVAVNCVVTPSQAESLVEMVASFLEGGIPKFRFALDMTREWNDGQIETLTASFAGIRKLLGPIYRTTGESPLLNFRLPTLQSLFRCDGGWDRLVLAPGPEVWGCHRAWEFFAGDIEGEEARKFRYGDLETCIHSFDSARSAVIPNYAILRHDFSHTPRLECIDCPEVGECGICPFTAAASDRRLGYIPDWVCRLLKLQRRERDLFLDENS